jgi:carbonic anhydrase
LLRRRPPQFFERSFNRATLRVAQHHHQPRTKTRRTKFHAAIVDRIRPSVQSLLDTPLANDNHALLHHAMRSNVRVSANHLRHGSVVLEQLIQNDGLLVIGAEYSLETGVVDFFDGLPE